MQHADFVHLHNHTQYSLLDGACKIDDLVAVAKSYKMPALAMTDHGNLFGAIEFYKKVKSAGIKPIIGSEVYVAPQDLHKKEPVKGLPDSGFHLILLAKNLAGYKNLVKLSTLGYLEGFYFKPRIDKKVLKQHSEGLIGLSSCLNGEVPALLLDNHYEKAKTVVKDFLDILGENNFYLELQDHNLDEEKKTRIALGKLASELNVQIVATNDCHYIKKEHFSAHDALLCIGTGKMINDTNRLRFATDQIYFKSPEEMKQLFADVPSAIENTLRIAEECNLELEFGKSHLPHFPLPSGFENLNGYLEYLANKGLSQRYPKVTPGLEERLNYELKVIQQMGYAGYFLVVKDFIDYARSQGIPVGPGRGSAAGSLVSYALGITNIDPIKYGLIFERFLNPERISMPDIDIDFSDKGRDKIIKYVVGKYGIDNVAQIITFGTMAARAVVRDVGRVLNMPYSEADKIAKMIPMEVDMTLQKALEVSYPLKQLYETSPQVKKVIEYSKTLEGLTRHASTHAAGVVIAPSKLTDFVPLYKTNKDEITTQYDMNGIEDIGLLKMDFLGLRTLTVIDNVLKRLRKDRGIDLDIDKIPLDDKKVFELFALGETVGIFQFESAGMRDYLKKLKPESLDDLTAMNALYRPGPLDSHMIDEYIQRKHDSKKIKYEHTLLEPILKETYGVIVYQEQVIKIASQLAGYTLGRADILRKAMGKKQASVMAQQREEFLKGCKTNGISEKITDKIFDQIVTFGRYGFNKSHSVGYAYIAYQTAYLKTYYPVEFMAATLSSEMGDTNRIVVLMEECRRMGIEILPPDVSESFGDFRVVGNQILFGLEAVKNVGAATVEAVIKAREKAGKFETVFSFCTAVESQALNRKALESLIQAGALDSLEGHRAQKMAVVDKALSYGQQVQKERRQGQTVLFGSSENLVVSEPKLPEVPSWHIGEILSKEKEMLGFYVSGHPLSKFEELLRLLATHSTETLDTAADEEEVCLGGIVVNLKTSVDKKGKQMGFVTLEDFVGIVEIILFSDIFEKSREYLYTDAMILVKGRISTREQEKPKIIATEVRLLAQALEKIVSAIQITVPAEKGEIQVPKVLKNLLSEHKGEVPIILSLPSGGENLRMRLKDMAVQPSEELLSQLKSLLGKDNVSLLLTRNSSHLA